MKKIIFVMLCALMIFGLVGCGEKSTVTPEDNAVTVTSDKVVSIEDSDTGMPENAENRPEQEGQIKAKDEPDSPELGDLGQPKNESAAPEQGNLGQAQNGSVAPEQVRPSEPDESGQQIIDMASVAEKLGVTEEALMDAMGDPTQGPTNFASAAEALGITEETLLDALGINIDDNETGLPKNGESRPEQGGPGRPDESGQQIIDTATAAEQLGVTEETLMDAMGDPAQGPPNFAAAAETLGITEADLLDALGITLAE